MNYEGNFHAVGLAGVTIETSFIIADYWCHPRMFFDWFGVVELTIGFITCLSGINA